MALEIEHKYLIKPEAWAKVIPHKSVVLQQAYLSTDPEKTIRVRTMNDNAYMTIKGKSRGAVRLEYEYEIPLSDARELIRNFCSNVVEKVRHYVEHEGKTWEVDEFKGSNEGLLVAEIELQAEDEAYGLPDWAGANVTQDQRYANSNLSVKPFKSW
jgi:adenylate cyclase